MPFNLIAIVTNQEIEDCEAELKIADSIQGKGLILMQSSVLTISESENNEKFDP